MSRSSPTLPATPAPARPVPFDRAPFMAFWEMTQACDLACRHCRACAVPDRRPDELTTAEAERLLDSIAAMGTKLVVLTGGDPAKRPDLVHLVRYGTGRGLRMALTPSATPLITRDLLVALRDAGLARLAVSLDGASHADHDNFRRVLGSHARTFEILRDAHDLGITTQINTTVTRFNVADLERMAMQIGSLGIELWSVFLIVPTGRATEADVLDPDEVERVLERLADLTERVPFDIKTTAAPHFRRVLLQRKVQQSDIVGMADGIGRAHRGINDGQGIAFVSHLGDVMPSGFLPIPCGNVRTESLGDIYRKHPLFRSLRDADALDGKCGDCEFRKVCGGSRARAYAMTGDHLASDPACAYQPRRKAPSKRRSLLVIGGGMSGLSSAITALRRDPKVSVTVLEAGTRTGGLIESERTDEGFLFEHGADCLASHKPAALRLAETLGLGAEVVRGGPAPRAGFVVRDGRLSPMPPSLLSLSRRSLAEFAASPLLSWSGKARAAREWCVPARKNDDDESVASFVERRFGAEVLDRLVEPLLTGIYGAPAHSLSAEMILSKLRQAEREAGSVTGALAREAPPPATPGSGMWTLENGMESLVGHARREVTTLGGEIRTQAPVREVKRTAAGRWRVTLASGENLYADAVVVATPAWNAAELLRAADSELAGTLDQIEATNLITLSVAWPRDAIKNALAGTGFIVPVSEGLSLRSCTFVSRKWPGRAPHSVELFRCFLRDANVPDATAIDAAVGELSSLLDISGEPEFSVLKRRARVLPVYSVGHLERRGRILASAARHPGLALAGNYLDGVGVGDVIDAGHRAVEQAWPQLASSNLHASIQ